MMVLGGFSRGIEASLMPRTLLPARHCLLPLSTSRRSLEAGADESAVKDQVLQNMRD